MKHPVKIIIAVALMMLPMLSSADTCWTQYGKLETNEAGIPKRIDDIIFKEGTGKHFVQVDNISYRDNLIIFFRLITRAICFPFINQIGIRH